MKNLIKYAFSIKILYICIMLISIICSVIAKDAWILLFISKDNLKV